MALKKVKGNLERMFDKNLNDLVRGIRNNKDNEVKYVNFENPKREWTISSVALHEPIEAQMRIICDRE